MGISTSIFIYLKSASWDVHRKDANPSVDMVLQISSSHKQSRGPVDMVSALFVATWEAPNFSSVSKENLIFLQIKQQWNYDFRCVPFFLINLRVRTH